METDAYTWLQNWLSHSEDTIEKIADTGEYTVEEILDELKNRMGL